MSGWTTKKLGEVCEVQLGKMLDKAKNKGKPYKYLANLSVRWRSFDLSNLRTMPFMDSEVEKFSLRPGDILMCEGGEPGRCAIWQIPDSDIKFQKAVHRIRSRGSVEPAYLVAYFESIVNTVEFNSRLTGATIKHLPRERLLEIPIPIPPLAEQKRIVAKIDAAFEKIDKLKANAEKNLANAKELFQSALDEAMRPKRGWGEKRLGEVYEITSSKRVFKSEWKTAGVPFYRAREIVKLAANGFVKNELFVSEEMYETYAQKYGIPKAGDIMITGVGTLGVCYVVKEDDKFYFKDGNIIWLKKCSNDVDSKFISLAFSTSPVRKQVLANAGTTVGTYTIIMAKNTVVQMPTIVEQKKIVNYVTGLRRQIETLQQNYARQIADCAEMRQAILREAFEGRL